MVLSFYNVLTYFFVSNKFDRFKKKPRPKANFIQRNKPTPYRPWPSHAKPSGTSCLRRLAEIEIDLRTLLKIPHSNPLKSRGQTSRNRYNPGSEKVGSPSSVVRLGCNKFARQVYTPIPN